MSLEPFKVKGGFKSAGASGLVFALLTTSLSACELCAIYSADTARGGAASGFLFTISEQYISAHTLLQDGENPIIDPRFKDAFLDSSFTHLVPGYTFSKWFALSLNAPVIHRDFKRVFLNVPPPPDNPSVVEESGTVTGLGDVALIGRWSLYQKIKMSSSITVNLLAGVKFPTGDTDRLDQEVTAAKNDPLFSQPNHPHGSIGGVHPHDLTLGSGSYDGVFGLTTNLRWKRWFFNNQVQYYLRTEGHSYKFGDLFIVSGGPGGYVPLGENSTLSLQANAFYEHTDRDEILGQTFNQTGMTAWYLGPLLNLNVGEHFSVNAGVDVPLRIDNHGLQTVPDYRVHGGITWRF